jgi:preprotein translocase subunit SecE
MNKLAKYVGDTMAELKQVSWPTQHQAVLYTALVIGISIAVSMFVGAFDYAFSQGISLLINRG